MNCIFPPTPVSASQLCLCMSFFVLRVIAIIRTTGELQSEDELLFPHCLLTSAATLQSLCKYHRHKNMLIDWEENTNVTKSVKKLATVNYPSIQGYCSTNKIEHNDIHLINLQAKFTISGQTSRESSERVSVFPFLLTANATAETQFPSVIITLE